MKPASLSDIDPRGGEGVDVRALSGPLGTTDVAINHYRVAPGEVLPAGLHAHLDQEEVFLVLEGRATFEVLLPGEDGESRVADELRLSAGEAVRFAPGEFQSGRNAGDDDLELLALGAPSDSQAVRLPVTCPACDHPDLGIETDDGVLVFACPSCGATRAPASCPECVEDDLAMTLGDDGEAVAACRACGATFERPPVEGEW